MSVLINAVSQWLHTENGMEKSLAQDQLFWWPAQNEISLAHTPVAWRQDRLRRFRRAAKGTHSRTHWIYAPRQHQLSLNALSHSQTQIDTLMCSEHLTLLKTLHKQSQTDMHSCPHAISHSAQDCAENLTNKICFARICHMHVGGSVCYSYTSPKWLKERLRWPTYDGV